MLNALWFKSGGGVARYREYGAAVQPLLESAGAELLFPFMPVSRSLDGGFDPDLVGFVRYPSREAFESMISSAGYKKVEHLRLEAIDKAVLTRCTIDPADAASVRELTDGVVVFNALWFETGGAATYDSYLQQASPLIEAIGGKLLTPRMVPEASLGEPFDPSLILLGYYPSEAALGELLSHLDYAAASETRSQALSRSATTLLHSGRPPL